MCFAAASAHASVVTSHLVQEQSLRMSLSFLFVSACRGLHCRCVGQCRWVQVWRALHVVLSAVC
jgi:hypothetical protein